MATQIAGKKHIPIPSIRLETLDRSVFNWFDKQFPVVIDGRKTPIIFSSGERWAQVQRQKGFRDEKGTLILPLISIRRTGIEPREDINQMAVLSTLNAIPFLRRIAMMKREDQKRVPFRQRQKNINTNAIQTDAPVYEILQIPVPDAFINVIYDVTLWASYIQHANVLEENIWDAARRTGFIAEGFFFNGVIEGGQDSSNFEDYGEDERIIRKAYTATINGYIFDNKTVEINRTISRIVLKEALYDPQKGNRYHDLSFDEMVKLFSKKELYDTETGFGYQETHVSGRKASRHDGAYPIYDAPENLIKTAKESREEFKKETLSAD